MAHRTRRPDKRRLTTTNEPALPLQIALNQAAKLLPAERTQVLAPVHAAFAAFRAGRGSAEHLAALADAMNLAADLAERARIASNHAQTIEDGKQAILALLDRHAASGSWTLKGTEIATLDLAVFIYKVQLDHCSRGELHAATQRVISRSRSALADEAAGRRTPGVTVRDVAAMAAAA